MRVSTGRFNKVGKSLVGVEIGVWRGFNAVSILENCDIHKLYLVDPYEEYEGYNINEICSHPYMNANKREAKGKLEPYKDTVQWVYKKSAEASKEVPNYLDFVYIDGNHSKEAIIEDIHYWYPKVVKGGVLAGHDFQKEAIRSTVINISKIKGEPLWSFPFEKADHLHNWQREWDLYKVPSDRISIDELDWWIIKS